MFATEASSCNHTYGGRRAFCHSLHAFLVLGPAGQLGPAIRSRDHDTAYECSSQLDGDSI